MPHLTASKKTGFLESEESKQQISQKEENMSKLFKTAAFSLILYGCSEEEGPSAADTGFEECQVERQAYQDNQYREVGSVSDENLFSIICEAGSTDRTLPDGNLGVFQDSKFAGNSQVRWLANRGCPSPNSCCVELHYQFNRQRTSSYTPYAGVYAFFSYIPYGPVDASAYDGVRIVLRAQPEIGSAPEVVLQLADIGPNTSREERGSCRDGYYQATVLNLGDTDEDFQTLSLDFADFVRPSWYNCSSSTPLQTNRIIKFGIVLLNNSYEDELQGIVQVANLHFQ